MNRPRDGVLVALLLVGSVAVSVAVGFSLAVVIAASWSPWWLALPVIIYAGIASGSWLALCADRREAELLAVLDRDLPDTREIDLDQFDCFGRWAGTPWNCDLEDGTGEKS